MKVRIAAAFGIGYVLGARAGRERYEEIRRTADRVQSDPRVQDVAQRAEAAVREATARVQEDPRVEQAVDTVREKVGGSSDDATGSSDTSGTSDAPSTSDDLGGGSDHGSWSTDPDEHVKVPEDELVHSVGPDDDQPTPGPGAHRA